MAETDERTASEPTEAQAIGTMQPELEAEAMPATAPEIPETPAEIATPPPAPTLPIRPARQPRPHARRRQRRQWRIVTGIASAVAVVVAAVLLAWPVPPAQPPRPAVVLIVPRGDGVECARDAEWAPDGTRLVVLGYARGCPEVPGGTAATTGTVLVYNALTGALMSRIQPDALIARAAAAPPGSTIQYAGALWSPNGKRLAITFGVASSSGPAIEGVYLCDADGGHAKVLLRTSAPADATSGMWDLQAGAYIPSLPLTPALGYQWTSAGILAASTPLTAAAAPAASQSGPIGLPDGGASFSTWQPAAITLRAPGTASQAAMGGAYVLSSSFAVWSPDGRYLLPSAGIQARLPSADAPAPSPATLSVLGLATTPLLPVRDRALQLALDRLGALAPDQRGTSPMLVAWSPEGRLLAVQLVAAEPSDVPHISHHALFIYDCATGKALVALTPDDSNTPTEGPTFVRWSPNGARLMLFDNQMGTLTIFGRSKIPQP